MPTVRLKKMLAESVRSKQADGLLFSGGLDTGILAFLNPELKAVTISLWPFGEDIQYAKMLEKALGLNLYHRIIKPQQAIAAIPRLIKIIKSFDPAIPNDLVVYFGLEYAKELGIKSMITGDGADELFGGYAFMRGIKDLAGHTAKIVKFMSFNSKVLGKAFGIEIIQPYLDEKIIDFSLRIPSDMKIKKEKDSIYGKWILRKSFEKDLAESVVWQSKRPLERGSGMSRLREIISAKISDKEFERAKKIGVAFINKEHYYYYKVYKSVVGKLPVPKAGQKACPACLSGMPKEAFHCKTCGGCIGHEED